MGAANTAAVATPYNTASAVQYAPPSTISRRGGRKNTVSICAKVVAPTHSCQYSMVYSVTLVPDKGCVVAPGDRVHVKHYGGKHLFPAVVLAVIKGRVMMEYTTPSGINALIFADAHAIDHQGIAHHLVRNPYGYTKLPVAWLHAAADAGLSWSGNTQTGKVPSLLEVLGSRIDRERSSQGWSRTGDMWTKTYNGHTLRVERRLSIFFAHVGTWPVGKYHRRKGNNAAWRRAAHRTHVVADSFGPAKKPHLKKTQENTHHGL